MVPLSLISRWHIPGGAGPLMACTLFCHFHCNPLLSNHKIRI